MTRLLRVVASGLAVAVMAIPMAKPAFAQEEGEKELGWFYTAELGFALAGGNASTTALNFGGGIRHEWSNATWLIGAAGLRAEQTTRTRTAVGADPTSFNAVEESSTDLTAETYQASTRYDRQLGGLWYAYAFGAWLRNTFAGIDSRWSAGAGVGNAWIDTDRVRFKTDYGLTYTNQSDVVPDPTITDSYVGIGAAADFWYKITSTTDFESQIVFATSFADSGNWRSNWLNALQVAISDALAFRTSLLFQYNNRPALEIVPLENPLGTPTGEFVPLELQKLDTFFTISLVLSI